MRLAASPRHPVEINRLHNQAFHRIAYAPGELAISVTI